MKEIPIGVLLISFWTLVGCVSQGTGTLPLTAPANDARTTASPTALPATNTPPASATFSSAPTLTVTPSVTATTGRVCPSLETKPSADFFAPGTIMFLDYSDDPTIANDRFYSLSPQDALLRPVLEDLSPAPSGGPVHISPDHKWVSIYHGSDLVLATSNPRDRVIIPGDTNAWISGIYYWLADSQHLVTLPLGATINKYDGIPQSIIVVNPFTRQQRVIEPSFSYEFPAWYWEEFNINVLYSPALDRVVYLEDAFTLVLWDVANEREVWRIKGDSVNISAPAWSPDGTYMAFVHSSSIDHIQIIDKDGNEVAPEIIAPGLVTTFGWSADGRYLSYWSVEAPNKSLRLFVFDLMAQQLIDTCITEPSISTLGSLPIWSPSSSQFIVGSAVNPEAYFTEWRFRTVILDVERNQVVQLDYEELEPVAWLKDEQ